MRLSTTMNVSGGLILGDKVEETSVFTEVDSTRSTERPSIVVCLTQSRRSQSFSLSMESSSYGTESSDKQDGTLTSLCGK